MFLPEVLALPTRAFTTRYYDNSRLSSNSSFLIYVVVFCIIFHLTSGLNSSGTVDSTPENKAEKLSSSLDVDLQIINQTKELQLEVVHNETLTLKMRHESKVKMNCTLYCSHPSIQYSITLSTEHSSVATVEDFEMFSITCADAVFEHKSKINSLESIPSVQGGFNFTLKADLLGRTWLYVLGERHADPGMVIPDILVLPWSKPETPNPQTLVTVSSNIRFENGSISPSSSPYYDKPDHSIPDTRALQKHVVTVLNDIRDVDKAFRGVLSGFIIIVTVGVGCKTDMSVVVGVLKKPVAPAIGFFCQYLFMPLIAFLIAKTLVTGDPAVSLGIFTCGICPGGGLSNMFSYLLDGDISLSVTMTTLSSVIALAMIPLWLFTLGARFEDDKISLSVPFARIIMTLAMILIPLFVGFAIRKWVPKVAKWVVKLLKPFTLIALLFMITFGVYVNLYVIRLLSARTLLAGCLLPYIGYLLGGLISFILRQPWYRVKTIAIETGIQNTNIAYLLLVFSLPTPDGELAAVGPMASALMTPLPLLVLVIVYLSYKRFCKKTTETNGREVHGKDEGEEGKEEEEEEAVALREEKEVKKENGDFKELKHLVDAQILQQNGSVQVYDS